jgi:hypothetical protein
MRPEPSEARAALVKRWLDDIAAARKHWKPDFERMRRNMRFAGGKQWPNQKENDDRYRVNLVQRVLKVVVSSLYAKNPTVVYKRRPKLDFSCGTASSKRCSRLSRRSLDGSSSAAIRPGARPTRSDRSRQAASAGRRRRSSRTSSRACSSGR